MGERANQRGKCFPVSEDEATGGGGKIGEGEKQELNLKKD